MRSVKSLILSALLLGTASASSEAFQVKPIPQAADVIGEAPVYQVGDEWHFTGGTYPGTVRVVAVEGGQIVTEFTGYTRCEGCRYFRDANLTNVKVLDAKGEPSSEGVIGAKNIDFPLRIGKEWKQDINLPTSSGIRPFTNRFVVEAYEEVTVKAGTFKAFRITQHQENRSSNWRGTATRWWSPEVRWWVRSECFRGSGLSRTGFCRDTELESYSLK